MTFTLIRILAVIAFVSVRMVAESQDGNPRMEDGEIRKLLPGTWTSKSHFEGYVLRTKIQFNSDGSYHEDHRLEVGTGEQHTIYQCSGAWCVKQGRLEKKTAKCNLPAFGELPMISINESELRLAYSTENKSDPQVYQLSKSIIVSE